MSKEKNNLENVLLKKVISNPELFQNYLKEKEHALIYYIYNIDKHNKTAKVEIIDCNKFNKLLLEPIVYKVSANLIQLSQ